MLNDYPANYQLHIDSTNYQKSQIPRYIASKRAIRRKSTLRANDGDANISYEIDLLITR